jgi:hypothetical protein
MALRVTLEGRRIEGVTNSGGRADIIIFSDRLYRYSIYESKRNLTFGFIISFGNAVCHKLQQLRASRISAFLSIKYWSTGATVEYFSDCAAAFGTRKPMLITSTKAMMLIVPSLVAALIARYPFAAAARSPL